jgi:hypothetical protein
MINIQYGLRIFVDGVIQEKPRRYNKYTVDGVEYNINLNIGLIFVIPDTGFAGDADERILFLLMDRYQNVLGSIHNKPELMTYSVYNTKRDTLLTKKCKSDYSLDYNALDLSLPSFRKNHDKRKFKWLIGFANTNIHKNNIKIPNLSSDRGNSIIDFLSPNAIVIDLGNRPVLTLPNGYRTLEYPLLTDYTAYKQDKISNISLDIYNTNTLNIQDIVFQMYIPDSLRNRNYDVERYYMLAYPIDWRDVVPAQRMDYSNNLILDIKRCQYIAPASKENPRCFITGVPLVDYCYVIDIYNTEKRNIEYKERRHILVCSTIIHTVICFLRHYMKYKFLVFVTPLNTDVLKIIDEAPTMDANKKIAKLTYRLPNLEIDKNRLGGTYTGYKIYQNNKVAAHVYRLFIDMGVLMSHTHTKSSAIICSDGGNREIPYKPDHLLYIHRYFC